MLFRSFSTAKELHEVWKVSLNILEQLSGVATKTNKMLNIAKEGNKNIVLATTRKHFPLTKDMMIHAVLSGGGIFHRLGLYDSILIFTQHRNFFDTKVEFEEAFKRAKDKFLEKKIVVEVDSFDEACYFASLGADVLQCEKMGYEELKECVGLKKEYSHIKVLATGGINLTNAKEYASCGVDALVTSSVYSANPCDIKAVITKVSDE